MCTVSVIRPLVSGVAGPAFRLVSNRDERRARVAGEPPRIVDIEGLRVAMPRDPDGGGTWVAVSDAGLAFAILNGADDGPGPVLPPSRGSIIPWLAGSESLDEAANRLLARDWRAFRPWRLLITDGRTLVTARPMAGRVRLVDQPLPRAFMTTSSSVHESRAAAARARLFHRIVTRADAAEQDAFHRHQWPDAPELSVRMSRPDACTVSRTVVSVAPTAIELTTEPVGNTHDASTDGQSVAVALVRASRAGAA